MKNRRLQRVALGALFIAEALGASGEVSANGGVSKMQIALTIENTCSIGTNPKNRDSTQLVSDLAQASQVTVKCTTRTTPYDVTLDAKPAQGEPLALRSINQVANETASSVVTVIVEF